MGDDGLADLSAGAISLPEQSVRRPHNQSHLLGVDSLQLSFEESALILRSLLPYFETGQFGPQGDPVPVGFDAVLSAYHELAEGPAKGKYVFVPL